MLRPLFHVLEEWTLAKNDDKPGLGWTLFPGHQKNFAAGLVMILAAAYIVSWNEGKAVEGFRAYLSGLDRITLQFSGEVDLENEGRLLYVSGKTFGLGPLEDKEFGIKAEGLCLRRKVEMAQWVEKHYLEEDSRGMEIVGFSYGIAWSENLIDSSLYTKPDHDNPVERAHYSKSFAPKDASLEQFHLAPEVCDSYKDYEKLEITEEIFNTIPPNIKLRMRLFNGGLFLGFKPENPAAGNLFITFHVAAPQSASIVAKQSGKKLVPALTMEGKDMTGFRKGDVSSEEMYSFPPGHGIVLAAALRLLALGLLAFAFGLVISPTEPVVCAFPKFYGLLYQRPGQTAVLLSLSIILILAAPSWMELQPLITAGMAAGALAAAGGIGYLYHKTPPKDPPVEERAPRDPSMAKPGPYNQEEAYKPARPPSLDKGEEAVEEDDHPSADWPDTWKSASGGQETAYKPAKPPPPRKPRTGGVIGGAEAKRIEHAFVFHEKGKMDRAKMAGVISKKEQGSGPPVRIEGLTGLHIHPWPEDKALLKDYFRRGILAYHKKHPESPHFEDKRLFDKKVWLGSDKSMGKYAVVVISAKS